MEENTKKEPVKPDEESLLDKAKKIVDKADDFLDEKAENTWSKLKIFGRKVAGKTADKLEDIAKDIKSKTKEDNKTENS